MPESVVVGILSSVATAIVGLGGFIVKGRRERKERLGERFTRVYAPLRALLLDTHVATWRSPRRPYLRERRKQAWKSIWRLPPNPLRALRDLFDKDYSSSTGIEYGDPMPLEQITALATANVDVTDPELLRLIQWAQRERLEDRGTGRDDDPEYLSDSELRLLDYILDEYERLANKVVPKP